MSRKIITLKKRKRGFFIYENGKNVWHDTSSTPTTPVLEPMETASGNTTHMADLSSASCIKPTKPTEPEKHIGPSEY